ncbi:MAG TPA: hypothetical protein VG432_14835 [Gemmatimonadaceae bacterium]|nr:hypothetical protein [Gemmatimonadaceae bacterium]
MRSSATVVALAATLLAVAGCGGDSNAPDTSHVGLYDMVSIDGDPLPATVIDMPGYNLQVTQGSLSLNANNTFVESLTSVETIDGTQGPVEAISCPGSYARSGNTITLTTPETDICASQRVIGTLSGSTLTVDYEGTTIVFRR